MSKRRNKLWDIAKSTGGSENWQIYKDYNARFEKSLSKYFAYIEHKLGGVGIPSWKAPAEPLTDFVTKEPEAPMLITVSAQYGSAGPASSQRRRNLRASGYLRKRTRASNLIACTYNCRSVSSAAQLSALIDESQRISYDIIGLSETKRKESLTCTWSDGTAVFLERGRQIQPLEGHRLAVLTAELPKGLDVSVIQVYAPTADRSEEEHEDFYDELGDLVRLQKCSYLVVMGDFNARVGPRKAGEHYIGTNGVKGRNESGERLANFCEMHHLFHGNSQFVKAPAKRWTHVSPNGQHFHELDHILCSRRAITDTGVVPSFSTGSDHGLLRARFHFDRGQIRLARIKSRRPRVSVLNEELVRAAVRKVDFGICADIDEDYEQLTSHLATIARQSRVAAPNHCVRRISEATKSLLARRRNVDRKANHLEFTLLNKLCRQRIAEDHQDFARRKLLKAAVDRASLKKAKRDIAEYRHVIPCLKTPDGPRQSSRAGMESIVSKFHTDLYKSNLRPNRQQPVGEEVLSILPSEVRHAIESMPRGKAPGTDKLSV
ncbi:unnamed protein product, partial [Nippostrongylus brasiliensis]|uniref:Endo/exonuclease/phosphatase domain-containing protein n=1 Tax=Nippostrongylus brasiliensis TaxID=27835 RepID=A0A0N4Y6L3_NIPBR